MTRLHDCARPGASCEGILGYNKGKEKVCGQRRTAGAKEALAELVALGENYRRRR